MTEEEREQLEDDLTAKIADILSYVEEHSEDCDTPNTIALPRALLNVISRVLDRAAAFDEVQTAYEELIADIDVTIIMALQMASHDGEQRKAAAPVRFRLVVNNERSFNRN
jgi:hypothetical protein